MANEPIYSFAALQNRLHLRGNLIALTAMRIGAGRSSNIIGNDLPVLRDAVGAPFVPGASLKGAFRSQVEALVRTVQPSQALDLQEIEHWQRDVISSLRDDEELANDRVQSEAIWKHSTLIDLTFGAPWTAGRLFFKDALVDRSLWFNQFEVRNGVAINRDTETVGQGLLYDYEVVPAGVRFTFELLVENAAPWQLGMVLLALRPWQNGDVQIGGFRSRGLGHVQLAELTARYTAIQTVDDVLTVLGYGNGEPRRLLPLTHPDEQMLGWFNAFKHALVSPQEAIEKGAESDA